MTIGPSTLLVTKDTQDEVQFIFPLSLQRIVPQYKLARKFYLEHTNGEFIYSSDESDLYMRIYDATPGHAFKLLHGDGFWKINRVMPDWSGAVEAVQIQIKIIPGDDVVPYSLGSGSCIAAAWKHIATQREALQGLDNFALPERIPSGDDITILIANCESAQKGLEALRVFAPHSEELRLLSKDREAFDRRVAAWQPFVKMLTALSKDKGPERRAEKLRHMVEYFDHHSEWDMIETSGDKPVVKEDLSLTSVLPDQADSTTHEDTMPV